jgi:hypothetical protein
LSRRVFLKIISSSPLLLVGCRPPSQSKQEPVSKSSRARFQSLDPLIRRALEKRFGRGFPHTADEQLLLDFLIDAIRNEELDTWLPVAFASDTGMVKLSKLTSPRLAATIELERFRYLSLGDVRVLLILTSTDAMLSLRPPIVERLVEWVTKYLTEIDKRLGGLYHGNWLHIDLLTTGKLSYTVGYNILLSQGAERYNEVICHELAHTYNSHLAMNTPTFITEGIADIIAEIVSGRSVLGNLATGTQVHLKFIDFSGGTAALIEAANGYVFFRRLLQAIGPDLLFKGIATVLRLNITDGLDVLRTLKAVSPNKQELEQIYQALIADYMPEST